MAPPKIRADYENLKDMASRFGAQEQAARQSLQSLQRELDTLQGGDWLGKGASAFYQEMGGQVMPTMKRLAAALGSAQQTTLQISQVMQQAEADAARLLHANGSGQAAAIGIGGVAGPGDGSGSGAGSGSGSGSGAGGGGAPKAATPQEIAASLEQMVDTMGTIGNIFGIDNMAATAAGQVAKDIAGASPAVKAAVMKALEEGSVDRKLSKFSSGARDLVKKSPTLRAEIFKLEQNNYTFKTGATADGYFTDWDNQIIVIDQPLSDKDTVAHIAHEVGHGVSAQQHLIPATPTMTRDQYVQQNVDNLMHNEGEAQLNAAQVRAELKAAGSGDIGIPGTQTAAYQAVYTDFAAGKITRAQAIDKMDTLMGNEKQSTPPYKAYRDAYADAYRDDWDTNIAPTRKKP